MARPKTVNYRKLAFEKKVNPVCVYCGFGVRAVLEVAHIDCDPANCSIENLVILCPTCHRMHDVDLIPSEIIVRMRDESRKPDWSKLYKDAPAKAVATKRKTPGLLKAAALKAVETRRKRKLEQGKS